MAGKAVAGGSSAVLNINAGMLGKPIILPDPPDLLNLPPDHWVVLKSPATFTRDHINFSVWSWGNIYPVSLRNREFKKTFFGAVICHKKA